MGNKKILGIREFRTHICELINQVKESKTIIEIKNMKTKDDKKSVTILPTKVLNVILEKDIKFNSELIKTEGQNIYTLRVKNINLETTAATISDAIEFSIFKAKTMAQLYMENLESNFEWPETTALLPYMMKINNCGQDGNKIFRMLFSDIFNISE